MRQIFNEQGIDGSKIIDFTPQLQGTRGSEIDNWLRSTTTSVESFVIIDDDSDMGNHIERLIHTTFENGLEMSHAEIAIRMLTEKI